MENTIFETHRLMLTTQSPVFIGDGTELNKKEYIREGNVLKIPDTKKMYSELIRMKKLDEYEQYMLYENRADLKQWLVNQKIPASVYDKWISYTMTCDFETAGKSQVNMMRFIKDPYGNPYVPGSSLKGALRTILLSYLIHQDPQKFANIASTVKHEAVNKAPRKKNLSREIKNLETEAFHTLNKKHDKPNDIDNAVNSMMSCLIISDSKPLSTADLIMCQKFDVTVDGTAKTINIGRECIKPQTNIYFDVTIDLRNGAPESEKFPFTVEDIKAAIKYFATVYASSFYKPFSEYANLDGKIYANTIWLGGGVGYVSKTITYPLLGKNQGIKTVTDIMQATVNDRTHHHENDPVKGVSPHMLKCTRYGGKRYEFGRCLVKFD